MSNRKEKIIPLRPRGKQKPLRKETTNRPYLRRTLLCTLVLCALFATLFGRLFQLMILQHDKYEAMAIDNQTSRYAVRADRGTIYDCNMNVLANSVAVENVFLDPNVIKNAGEDVELIATGLSKLLDVEEDFIREQAADDTQRYKVVKRRIPQELADQVRAFIDENKLTGVALEMDSQRVYPYSTLASQVIGFTNAENKGSEGLEAGYDSVLQGTAGEVIKTRGNQGTEMLYNFEKYYEATGGSDLVLTIDNSAQFYLEKNLTAAIEKYDVQNGAFGVIMDVNTGAIKAMSTMGSYDPNSYLDIGDPVKAEELEKLYAEALDAKAKSELPAAYFANNSTKPEEKTPDEEENPNEEEIPPEGEAETSDGEEEIKPTTREDYEKLYEKLIEQYNQEMAEARLKQWRNRAVSDGYEPGSTFKTITLAAALEEGAVSLEDTWYCGGSAKIEKRDDLLHCWKSTGHGSQTTAQALQNSCNLAFANIGIALGGNKLYEYVKAFGLLEQTGIDLPGEATGYFFSQEALANPESYASLTSAAFGQTFKVTPMQLVRGISAVVNGGYVLQPYLVSEVLDADGNVTVSHERNVLRQAISEQTSKTMCELMESVVTDGTAGNAKVVGYSIGGKTGTSEKIDVLDEDGNRVDDKIVSFVGVAPIDNPQYIVLVALDTPSKETGYYISGGVMAAPVVRDVFTDILPYFGVTPHYSEDELHLVNVTMPNVVALSRDEAQKSLEDAYLKAKFVGEGEAVTDQIPAAGGAVPGNSTVLVYLGEEKPTDLVQVPDLIGLTQYEANITISNTGGLYLQCRGSTSQSGTVSISAQSIEAGTQVERGTTITVELTDSSARD